MKKKIIISIILTLLFISNKCHSQEPNNHSNEIDIKLPEKTEWEKPFNFFAAAGTSLMLKNHYNVAVSPIDNTIHFERTYPIVTRFSLGLVWNPLPERRKKNEDGTFIKRRLIHRAYDLASEHFAVALLVNVLKLSNSNDFIDFNASSLIDVGFGAGYRLSNFLVLGTIEFTPLRTPRAYFINQYNNKNLQLIPSGSTEPIRTISTDDNALFVNKIFPSIGIKIAYSFTKQK